MSYVLHAWEVDWAIVEGRDALPRTIYRRSATTRARAPGRLVVATHHTMPNPHAAVATVPAVLAAAALHARAFHRAVDRGAYAVDEEWG